jgi:integrating conjugative element protein (TIGR03761 family)
VPTTKIPDLPEAPAQLRPGKLQSDGESSFELHTLQAQRLLAGRTSPRPIMGLAGFVRVVSQIRRSAQYDDPFAAWALIRLDEEDERVRKLFTAKRQEMRLLLKSMESDGVTLQPLVSSCPIYVPLQFGNNHHAYRAALLLKSYDQLVLLILSAERYGMVDREFAWSALLAAGRAMRRLLHLPAASWRYTGITRQDVRSNNRKAEQVAAVYQGLGLRTDLPPEVLEGIRRSRFGPLVRVNRERAQLSFLDEQDNNEPGREV